MNFKLFATFAIYLLVAIAGTAFAGVEEGNLKRTTFFKGKINLVEFFFNL